MTAEIKVSSLTAKAANLTTFTYAIDDVGGSWKLAINAADGIPIYDASGYLIPITDGSTRLGSSTKRWGRLTLAKGSAVILWDDTTGNGDELGYTNGVGPYFFDNTAGFAFGNNLQSLTADRVVTWPDMDGKVVETSAATMGRLTLNGATEVTVTTAKATTAANIFLTVQSPAGTPSGVAYVSSRVNGVSFGVKGVALDTSVVAWHIIEP